MAFQIKEGFALNYFIFYYANMNNEFFLNGYKFSTNFELTILDILHYFNYKKNFFIVEYNNVICDQKKWSKVKIGSNDKIEIISIVGGG